MPTKRSPNSAIKAIHNPMKNMDGVQPLSLYRLRFLYFIAIYSSLSKLMGP